MEKIILAYLFLIPSLAFCQLDKKFIEIKEYEFEAIFKSKEISVVIEYHGNGCKNGEIQGIRMAILEDSIAIYKFDKFDKDSLVKKVKFKTNKKSQLYSKLLTALKGKADMVNNYKSIWGTDNKVIQIFSGDKYLELIIMKFPENDLNQELEWGLKLVDN